MLTFGVLSNVYETLTTIGPQGRVRPALAARWENPDDVTWRFVLRPGVRFHDGRRLDAADVVASLERARSHPQTNFSSYLVEIREIEAAAPDTVEIRTARPYPILLNKLAFISVVPADAPEEITEPVGTGPYRLAARDGDGRLRLEAVDGHWRGAAAEPVVELVPVGDAGARREMLVAGEVDVVQDPPAAALEALDADPCCRVSSRDGLQVEYLAMRVDHPPFDDLRVRRALHLALDRRALVAASLDGHGTPAGQMVGPNVFGYDPDLAPPEPDPEAARALLAEAGWADGLEVVLEHRHGRDPAPLVAQLAWVGIEVTPVGRPWDEMFRRLQSGAVDFYFGGMLAVSADASDIFDSMVHTRDRDRGYGQNNWLGFADPELDGLIEQSGTTLDMRARRAVLEQAMGVLMDRLPYVPLFYNHEVFAVRRGVAFEPRLDGMIRVHEIRRSGG